MGFRLMEKIEQIKYLIVQMEELVFNSPESIKTKDLHDIKKELISMKIKNPDNEQIKTLYEVFENLENTYERIQDDKINDRLNILTIWSTLFLPLSFFTGMFGMNFSDVPFLNEHYGFWIFVLISFLCTGGLWLYFRKNKWF